MDKDIQRIVFYIDNPLYKTDPQGEDDSKFPGLEDALKKKFGKSFEELEWDYENFNIVLEIPLPTKAEKAKIQKEMQAIVDKCYK